MESMYCIICPKGCKLEVETLCAGKAKTQEDLQVKGNSCPRGKTYAESEILHPERMITTTVRTNSLLHPCCPVKTARPVPKGKIAQVLTELRNLEVQVPIDLHAVLCADAAGTGIPVISTKKIIE